MTAAFAIAANEVRQHRLVLWAALVCGLLPLLLLLAPVNRALPMLSSPGEAHPGVATAAWFLAVVLSIAVAAGLGMDAFARDLRDHGLGFWLSRPLPLFQYWAGKLGAAWLLAVAAAVIVMIPGHVIGALDWAQTAVSLQKALGWRGWLVGLALMVATANAVASALRVRSALLVLDIVMVPVFFGASWLALGSASQSGTLFGVLSHLRYFLAAAGLVLLAAGAAQVCLGRMDLRRGHVLLSTIAWGGLLAVFVGGILALSRHVAGAPPTDLRFPHGVWVEAPPLGSHVMLAGSRARNVYYEAGYLVAERGDAIHLGGLEMVFGGAWSRDGRTYALSRAGLGPGHLDPERRRSDFLRGFGFEPSVWIFHIDQPGELARRLTLEGNASVAAVSPEGNRLLLGWNGGRAVIDGRTGRSLASIQDNLSWYRETFLTEGSLRALRSSPRTTAAPVEQATIVDWDLESGRVTERGTIALQGGRNRLAGRTPSEDWQKVLRFDATGLYLHDLGGQVVATLVNGWTTRNRAAGPFSDDRYGCIEEEPSALYLRVFAADGRLLSEARLPGRFPLRVGGEPRAGVLALGVAPLADEGERATLFVDLATGTVVGREHGLDPAIRRWQPGNDLEVPHVTPGSFATRLFVGNDGLVSLDPATGAKRVVVAGRSRLAEN